MVVVEVVVCTRSVLGVHSALVCALIRCVLALFETLDEAGWEGEEELELELVHDLSTSAIKSHVRSERRKL